MFKNFITIYFLSISMFMIASNNDKKKFHANGKPCSFFGGSDTESDTESEIELGSVVVVMKQPRFPETSCAVYSPNPEGLHGECEARYRISLTEKQILVTKLKEAKDELDLLRQGINELKDEVGRKNNRIDQLKREINKFKRVIFLLEKRLDLLSDKINKKCSIQ